MNDVILVPLASTTHERNVNQIYNKHRNLLKNVYSKSLPILTHETKIDQYSDLLNKANVILALACTGGTKKLIVHLAKFGTPLIILTHNTQNSLASGIHGLTILRKRNYPAIIFHNVTQDNLPNLKKLVEVAMAIGSLKNKNILLLGITREWLLSEGYDINKLENMIRVRVITLDLDDLIKVFESSKPDTSIIDKYNKYSEVETVKERLSSSSIVYSTVKDLLHKTNAISYGIRCFPFIIKTRVTPCIAVSHSIDEEIIAACEADLGALITMLLAHKVTKHPVFMGNIEDLDDNELILAHCTIATRFVDDLVLRSHFETRSSVSIAGKLKAGQEVTIVKISNDFSRMLIMNGKISVGEPWSEDFCRTQFKIKVENLKKDVLLKNPVGSHLVLVKGTYITEFKILAEFLGMNVV